MIKIIIATNNAAFEDGYKELESSRIISEAADKVESDQFDFKLRDINGNIVGRLEETDGEPDLEPGNNYIVLGIATDNAAFEDNGKGRECARILREAATKMRDGDLDFKLRDINGNTVGRVEQMTGIISEDVVADAAKEQLMAVLTGSLKEGVVVRAILPETKAEELIRNMLTAWPGGVAEAIEITNPSKFNADFEADPDGELVVIFGTVSAGLEGEVYGPFGDQEAAVAFADDYRGTYDTQYEIFQAVENGLTNDATNAGMEP